MFWSLLFITVAHAFTLNSSSNPNQKGWSSNEVNFYLNPQNCPAGLDVESVIGDALKVWNAVPTSNIKVGYGGTTSTYGYSDPPTIICSVNFATDSGGADIDSVPAVGGVIPSGNNIRQGILILNASSGLGNIGRFDATTLKVILAHEIGHVLGLGHSEDPNALMYYDASDKEHLALAQDDVDGISYLYPRNELGPDKLMGGCGRIQSSPKGGSSDLRNIALVLFLLPLLLALILRKRLPQRPPTRSLI